MGDGSVSYVEARQKEVRLAGIAIKEAQEKYCWTEDLKEFRFDFDEFFNDVYFFFKVSGARRKNYAFLQDVANVAGKYIKKYTSTRWLSMKYTFIPLVEQLPYLTEYFLTFLPKAKEFRQLKKSLSGTSE